MKKHIWFTAAALVGLAACGSDSGATTGATADTVPAATAPSAGTASDTGTASSGTGTAADAAFPVTIEHKYGETTVDAEPQRIVSIGFGEHDGLLSLGVVPVAVRDWYGEQPYATWPWAQDELGGATPEVLPSSELNFEQIAALQPDLILGLSSGMTDADYATLSAIAPTIAQPADYIDYGTPWDVALEITGRAVGRSEEAAAVVARTEELFAGAVAEHPEFEGATASVTFFWEDQPGAYGSEDVRSRVLGQLGFVVPEAIDELAGDAFYVSLSSEDLSLIDTDVVVWIGSDAETFASIRDLPTRTATTAFAEGRELVADDLLSAAFSHSSPLSLEYVIEALVPELALAVDGDPSTAVPSAAVIAPAGDPGEAPGDTGSGTAGAGGDAAADAAAAAWALVFDSSVAFDDKAAHLADAAALQGTVEAYTAAGDAMGGITLAPTEVTLVDDTTATVTYDVLFGGTAAYTALTGVIELVDGTWTVSRAEFCGFMASARTACPA